MTDYLQKKKDRLAKLRTLTEHAHGIDFDRIRNYFSRVQGPVSDTAYKIRREIHTSKRHHLVEELALTAQHLARSRRVLQNWEADLLDRYDQTPDAEILAWIKQELNQVWDRPKLLRQILRIKRKVGAVNERLRPHKKREKKINPKPRFMDFIQDAISTVTANILGPPRKKNTP